MYASEAKEKKNYFYASENLIFHSLRWAVGDEWMSYVFFGVLSLFHMNIYAFAFGFMLVDVDIVLLNGRKCALDGVGKRRERESRVTKGKLCNFHSWIFINEKCFTFQRVSCEEKSRKLSYPLGWEQGVGWGWKKSRKKLETRGKFREILWRRRSKSVVMKFNVFGVRSECLSLTFMESRRYYA